MRIVGGLWRGRQIEAPEGRAVTRPTTDRMREAMASMLLSAFDLDLSAVDVLDAFAGSGAVGLELLSRGARSCTFVESDRASLARVRRNAKSLGAAPATCAFVGGDAFRLAERANLSHAPFALVVLDPPYAFEAERVGELVCSLAAAGLLAPDALVLYERSSAAPQLPVRAGERIKTKTHGTTALDLVRIGGPHVS